VSTRGEAAGGPLSVAFGQETSLAGDTKASGRRIHEIDAMRSIALILLVAYHALCAFQPFSWSLGIVGFPEHLTGLWLLGELLNTWRIPVLFLMAGVTAGHLLGKRQPTELIRSRLLRLVPPLLMGILIVVPLSSIPFQLFHHIPVRYMPSPGHLWFVWNLVVYFAIAFPLLVIIKRFPHGFILGMLRFWSPYGWLFFLPGLLGLTTIFLEPHVTPEYFSAFFIRFWYGLACFVSGIVLVSLGESFWSGLHRVCHPAFVLGLVLYGVRITGNDWGGETSRLWANSFESAFGMLAFLGYGSLLFSRPSLGFLRFNRAVFAIYLVHFPVQQALAVFLIPLGLPPSAAFVMLFIGTLAISALVYWLVLCFLHWLHPFFGIPPTTAKVEHRELPAQASMFPYRWMPIVGRCAALYLVAPLLVLVTFLILGATAFRSWKPGTITPIIQQQGTNPQGASQGRTMPSRGFSKDRDEP